MRPLLKKFFVFIALFLMQGCGSRVKNSRLQYTQVQRCASKSILCMRAAHTETKLPKLEAMSDQFEATLNHKFIIAEKDVCVCIF